MSEGIGVYLVVGDDPYLVGSALERIISEGGSSEDVASFGPSDDLGTILTAASTPSMFGGRRVLVLRGVESLGADEQRRLASYLEDPTPEVTLVLVASKKVPRLAEIVKKVGKTVEVSKGRRSELFTWVKSEAAERGLKISGDAMTALLEASGEERTGLANALDELRLALGEGARVGSEAVRTQFAHRGETRVFAFVDAVAARQTSTALELLTRLLRQESPQRLFWTLTSHFRMLLATEGSSDEVAGRLGLPRWRAEKLVRQARGFPPERLIAAYEMLAECDRKMKASEEPEELTLERAVVAIAGG
jgi:DNA polymerase-3 subunit delta